MITYCASDILREAKTISNTLNVDMPDFATACSILNSEYHRLYNDIVNANGASVKEVEMEYPPYFLPEDCYHIIGVYRNKHLVKRSSVKQRIKGTYTILNNEILTEGPFTLRYSLLPQTITAPIPMQHLDLENIAEVGLVTDFGFYYIDNDAVSLFYDFSTATSIEKEYRRQSNRFLEHTLDFIDGKLYYNEEDVTFIFNREDVNIESVKVSDPYVIVNYDDNTSWIFHGFDRPDILNFYESKGKPTYGKVLSFTTNDLTGRGCVWQDLNGDLFLTSFVPDTLLNYPNNTFFQLLIYRIAATLISLNGDMNQYLLEALIPDAEVAFYNHLAKDNITPMRINI